MKVTIEKAPTEPQFVKVIVEKHTPETRTVKVTIEKALTVPVSMRGLLQRINRKLASKNEIIRASRGSRAKSELGDFFTLDVSLNCIVDKDVSPIDLARELGILKPYEHVSL